jgi:hypothetical protein
MMEAPATLQRGLWGVPTLMRRRWGSFAWLAAIVVAATLATASRLGAAEAFDPARYQPGRLSDVASVVPAAGASLTLPDFPILARVQYLGELRPLPEDSQRHIEAWAEAMGIPEALAAFRREVKVSESGTEYWLPVQEALVQKMTSELRVRETIEVFVIHIGHTSGRPIFLVNAFDHQAGH